MARGRPAERGQAPRDGMRRRLHMHEAHRADAHSRRGAGVHSAHQWRGAAMNRDAAEALAKDICSAWRTTIPRNLWADYLAGLDDPDRARRVFDANLERELPTFKEFGAR